MGDAIGARSGGGAPLTEGGPQGCFDSRRSFFRSFAGESDSAQAIAQGLLIGKA